MPQRFDIDETGVESPSDDGLWVRAEDVESLEAHAERIDRLIELVVDMVPGLNEPDYFKEGVLDRLSELRRPAKED